MSKRSRKTEKQEVQYLDSTVIDMRLPDEEILRRINPIMAVHFYPFGRGSGSDSGRGASRSVSKPRERKSPFADIEWSSHEWVAEQISLIDAEVKLLDAVNANLDTESEVLQVRPEEDRTHG